MNEFLNIKETLKKSYYFCDDKHDKGTQKDHVWFNVSVPSNIPNCFVYSLKGCMTIL